MEKYKDIEGYEGKYAAGSFGNVCSINYHGTGKSKILKIDNSRGYSVVTLSKNGKTKRHSMHRVIAQAFISNPENKPQVNHINGIKSDNRVENLEWCTASENERHKYKLGYSQNKGERNSLSKKIIQLDKTGCVVREWIGIREISRALSIKRQNIQLCCKGKVKSCSGFIFIYG